VTATVTYARDHHPVQVQVVLSITAVSDHGHTIGPIAMVASDEGQNFYVSRSPLPVGKWTVTVTATAPSPATKTVGVTSAVPPRPHAAAPAPSGLAPMAVAGTAAAVLIVAAFFAVALIRRRRLTQ
jgi:hypothetical protein